MNEEIFPKQKPSSEAFQQLPKTVYRYHKKDYSVNLIS